VLMRYSRGACGLLRVCGSSRSRSQRDLSLPAVVVTDPCSSLVAAFPVD
jgi:hypothetical protein